MDYDWIAIGERIKDERDKLSLTQDELADRVQFISRQLLSKWERAISPPTLDNLLDLCKVFKCDLGYLLCEPEYSCKTRQATDIQAATGLSEPAIESLLDMKNAPGTKEDLSVLNQLLVHVGFIDFLKSIQSYSLTVNVNRYRSELTEDDELVAAFFNCEPSDARKYLEAYSASVIQSVMMKIVHDIE